MSSAIVFCPYRKVKVVKEWSDYITNTSEVSSDRPFHTDITHIVQCDDCICLRCNGAFKVFGTINENPETGEIKYYLTATV